MGEIILHVLLVEDDEDYRSLLRQRLASLKDRAWSPQLRVLEAGSLAEAEQAVSQQPADAILLDLMLPDSAGMESVARIRAVAPDAAVIVLTGRAEEGWIQQALQAGVQDYLFKSSVSQESLGRSLRYAVERKHAEVALLNQERRYRALVENAADLVLVMDDAQRVQYASPSVLPILGYVPTALAGQPFPELIHADDRARLAMDPESLGMEPGCQARAEVRVRSASGQWRILSLVLTGLAHEPAIRGTVVNGRDVTEQRQAEEALHRSQHLQSLGLLAGGVAHDFNNLLTSIATQNTLAQAKSPPGSPARTHLEKSARAVSAAAELTRKLLTYAGEQQPTLAATDLNEAIDQYIRLLAPSLPPSAQVHVHLADALPTIDADANQVQRLAMNLLVNAAEALDHSAGDVWIRTGVEHLTEDELGRYVTTTPLPSGLYVYLEVCDNGTGMDDATLRRVFEPFFTTKPEGHGLGLSTVAGIVRTHQAGICVESAPGAGARFRVVFPRGRLPVQPEAPTQPPRAAPRSAVLVIDDEALVVEAVADALAAAGFTALTADRGAQGIELFRAHQDEIGAVIVDVRMPQMSGVETLRRLRQIDPGVQVILFSGHTGQEDVQPYLRAGHTDFLQKPLDVDRLLGLVTSAIHRPQLLH